MATVHDIVRDALLHLGVQDAYQPVKAVDMADGIRSLNLMMRAWAVDGLNLGWSDVANPSDTLPAPPEAEEAIGYNLAVRIAPRYERAPDPAVVGLAVGGLSTLSAQVTSNQFVRTEYPDLPVGAFNGFGYGWRNGFYG